MSPDGPVGSVSSKWSKGSGGPAGDECYNLVADVAPTLVAGGNKTGGNRYPGTKVDEAGGLIVTVFEDRDRGDDGRGYGRMPNFTEDVAPALNTVKAPVVSFDCKAGGNTSFSVGDQAGALRASHGGGHSAVAIPILEAGARTGKSTTDIRAGLGDAEVTLQSGKQHAVAVNLLDLDGGAMPETSDAASLRSASGGSSRSYVFKPSHYTRGKDGQPSAVSPPLGGRAGQGGSRPAVDDGDGGPPADAEGVRAVAGAPR